MREAALGTITDAHGVEHALSERVAQIVARIIEGAEEIDRVGVGHVEVWFDGKRVHALRLTEQLTPRTGVKA